jgi:hypothetical protein
MPRRDHHHDTVVHALEKGGWTITDDPFRLGYGRRNLYVDLGAENLLAAEKDQRRIAVEIKGFAGASDMRDLEVALGQYVLYRDVLAELEPERTLHLAIPVFAYEEVFSDKLGQLVVRQQQLQLIVYDEEEKEIVRWLP